MASIWKREASAKGERGAQGDATPKGPRLARAPCPLRLSGRLEGTPRRRALLAHAQHRPPPIPRPSTRTRTVTHRLTPSPHPRAPARASAAAASRGLPDHTVEQSGAHAARTSPSRSLATRPWLRTWRGNTALPPPKVHVRGRVCGGYEGRGTKDGGRKRRWNGGMERASEGGGGVGSRERRGEGARERRIEKGGRRERQSEGGGRRERGSEQGGKRGQGSEEKRAK